MNAQEIAENLLSLLEEAAYHDEIKKQKNSEAESLKSQLHEAMIEKEMEVLQIQGIKFTPIVEQDFSMNDEIAGTNKFDESEDFFNWLKNNGMGGCIKTKVSVHPRTRKSTLKDWLEQGNSLPEFISEKLYPTINYNKSEIQRRAKAKIDV